MDADQLLGYLGQKKRILEKIQANTDTQLRFVCRREMRGLARLLRDRQKLIMELATVNLALDSENGWKANEEFKPWMDDFAARQRLILEVNDRVVEAALAEKTKVAATLRHLRRHRSARNCYLGNRLATMGGRINQKG